MSGTERAKTSARGGFWNKLFGSDKKSYHAELVGCKESFYYPTHITLEGGYGLEYTPVVAAPEKTKVRDYAMRVRGDTGEKFEASASVPYSEEITDWEDVILVETESRFFGASDFRYSLSVGEKEIPVFEFQRTGW